MEVAHPGSVGRAAPGELLRHRRAVEVGGDLVERRVRVAEVDEIRLRDAEEPFGAGALLLARAGEGR